MNYNEEKDGKTLEHPDLAFSQDGLDAMNKNIKELNENISHKPIYKVRTYESKGNKFVVGQTGNKNKKYVEAAKGTNLFFAIYQDANGKRYYETIPLNIVIERQKQGLTSVPESDGKGNILLLHLSPNDLVYIPTESELDNINLVSYEITDVNRIKRIYKMVSSTNYQCFFIQHSVSTSIVNKFEFSALNKMEKSIDGIMIKDLCMKIKIDRLGKIQKT